MEKTIKLADCTGTSGRSRINANKLGLTELPKDCDVVLDFEGIKFLSRSFTDEVISQMGERKWRRINISDNVERMFQAVINGRSQKRVHESIDSPIIRFTSMVELSKYLNTAF